MWTRQPGGTSGWGCTSLTRPYLTLLSLCELEVFTVHQLATFKLLFVFKVPEEPWAKIHKSCLQSLQTDTAPYWISAIDWMLQLWGFIWFITATVEFHNEMTTIIIGYCHILLIFFFIVVSKNKRATNNFPHSLKRVCFSWSVIAPLTFRV